ncbi:MAG: zeta toxin family protein [Candidatus Taylorbacteria bacterium]|nr:zeta toxin family protein [Candidatus Taylorbacteria bacterium]
MNDEEIRAQALAFAKKNKVRLARELTDPAKYRPDKFPISVFMAGSPGAGKTEYSRNLIDLLERDDEFRVVRIDGDEIRPLIPGYTGSNSFLFQGAISLVVEKMHDLLLHNNQSFILDGTFTKYEKAISNVQRSIEHNRLILNARVTVQKISETFGNKVIIYVVKKDFTTNAVESVNKLIMDEATIDRYVSESYTRDDLEKML